MGYIRLGYSKLNEDTPSGFIIMGSIQPESGEIYNTLLKKLSNYNRVNNGTYYTVVNKSDCFMGTNLLNIIDDDPIVFYSLEDNSYTKLGLTLEKMPKGSTYETNLTDNEVDTYFLGNQKYMNGMAITIPKTATDLYLMINLEYMTLTDETGISNVITTFRLLHEDYKKPALSNKYYPFIPMSTVESTDTICDTTAMRDINDYLISRNNLNVGYFPEYEESGLRLNGIIRGFTFANNMIQDPYLWYQMIYNEPYTGEIYTIGGRYKNNKFDIELAHQSHNIFISNHRESSEECVGASIYYTLGTDLSRYFADPDNNQSTHYVDKLFIGGTNTSGYISRKEYIKYHSVYEWHSGSEIDYKLTDFRIGTLSFYNYIHHSTAWTEEILKNSVSGTVFKTTRNINLGDPWGTIFSTEQYNGFYLSLNPRYMTSRSIIDNLKIYQREEGNVLNWMLIVKSGETISTGEVLYTPLNFTPVKYAGLFKRQVQYLNDTEYPSLLFFNNKINIACAWYVPQTISAEGWNALLGNTVKTKNKQIPESGSNKVPGGGNSKKGGSGTSSTSTNKPLFNYKNDNTSIDKILTNDLPILSGGSFINMYEINDISLESLGNEFWEFNWQDVVSTVLGQSGAIEAIIGLKKVPFTIPSGNKGNTKSSIKIGGQTFESIDNTEIYNNIVDLDFGSLNIDEYYGSYLDYEQTEISIMLPFIGVQKLNTYEVMNSKINLNARVDILTGSISYYITVDKDNYSNTLYSFTGNISYDLPVVGRDYTQKINSVVTAGIDVGIAAMSSGVASGVTASHLASDLPGALFTKPSTTRTGNLGGGNTALSIMKPYLIITRPKRCLPESFGHEYGYPSNITTTIGKLSGFNKVAKCHLTNIPQATKEELDLLYEKLTSGFIM